MRRELLHSLERWQLELKAAAERRTTRFGMVYQCYALLDEMLEICATHAVELTGEVGKQALAKRMQGKRKSGEGLGNLTLGQRIDVLRELDSEFAKALRQKTSYSGRKVLGKQGSALLETLSSNRNNFAHGRANISAENPHTVEEMQRIRTFCEGALVSEVIRLQSLDASDRSA